MTDGFPADYLMLGLGAIIDAVRCEMVEVADDAGTPLPDDDRLRVFDGVRWCNMKLHVLDELEALGFVEMAEQTSSEYVPLEVTEAGRLACQRWRYHYGRRLKREAADAKRRHRAGGYRG